MKVSIERLSVGFLSLGLVIPVMASAAGEDWDLSFQPRVEGGVSSYEFKAHPAIALIPSTATTFGYLRGNSQFKYKADMPFLGAGLTLFANRWFVDLSGRKTFQGSDDDHFEAGTFDESGLADPNVPVFVSDSRTTNADIEREEYAISLGYGITDQIALFGGYKWARTDLKTHDSGSTTSLYGDGTLDGPIPFTERENIKFKYDGPFVGLTYGLPVTQGLFDGALSLKFALAFLDGKLDSFNPDTGTSNALFSGDTLGATFGVAWRGKTSMNGLTYSLGVDGFQYSFEAKDRFAGQPDVNETVVNYTAGLAYLF